LSEQNVERPRAGAGAEGVAPAPAPAPLPLPVPVPGAAGAVVPGRKIRVLAADDEAPLLRALRRILEAEGCEVMTAENGEEAIAILERTEVDVALCDLRMPKVDGMELLRHIRRAHPDVEVVMMTAHATIDNALAAVRAGAYDYLTKPFEDVTRVSHAVKKAAERRLLIERARHLEAELSSGAGARGPVIIGESPKLQQVVRLAESVADIGSTVLITGESGTGKEMIARLIHARGVRAKEPFVALNCSALTDTLLDAELFGHTKGAFTGAVASKAGLFEAADGGTIFLDEIGDVPLGTQVKLLRVLQEGEVRRVMSNDVVKVDVRVIAATNVDLRKAMKAGTFREDLYFRLAVIHLHLPPLRERPEDVPLLAHYFLRQCAARFRKTIRSISPEAMELLVGYPWRGNVRELENAVERAAVLATGDTLVAEHLPPDLAAAAQAGSSVAGPARQADYSDLTFAEARKRAVADFTRRYVAAVIDRAAGNVAQAARVAGVDRSNLRRLMRRAGVERADTDE
jgi:DNA-binding NtrC family response regulator